MAAVRALVLLREPKLRQQAGALDEQWRGRIGRLKMDADARKSRRDAAVALTGEKKNKKPGGLLPADALLIDGLLIVASRR